MINSLLCEPQCHITLLKLIVQIKYQFQFLTFIQRVVKDQFPAARFNKEGKWKSGSSHRAGVWLSVNQFVSGFKLADKLVPGAKWESPWCKKSFNNSIRAKLEDFTPVSHSERRRPQCCG